MEKEFVPYELAVKLRSLGFNEPCFYWYTSLGNFVNAGKSNQPPLDYACSAPTFSQAFRWFRERYSLYSHIRESYAFDNTLGFVSQINGSCVTHGIVDKPINRFDTYEEAELACLTKLIEIVETRTK